MTLATETTWPKLKIGQRVRFLDGPAYHWTVRAVSDDGRYAVCATKGWKLYSIIDWQRGHRGAENLVFGMDCQSEQDAVAMLRRLDAGTTEVSWRNWVWLRFHDEQPDPRSRSQLPELVRGAFAAWQRHPHPQNNYFKDKPWAGLGPVVESFWQILERENRAASGSTPEPKEKP